MTDTSERHRQFRVRSNRNAFLEAARPTAYAMVNGFLVQHWAMSSALQMRPAKLLVFLTIVMATVQRTMRHDALPDELRGVAPMARSFINFSTRRAIAEATGLPRENVRRIVDELTKEGLLVTDARGRIANKGQILAKPGVLSALQVMLAEQARTADELIATGALEVSGIPT